LFGGRWHTGIWESAGDKSHISRAITKVVQTMGHNVSCPTGCDPWARRIPPIFAIRRWSGSHPKSMYSTSDGISETDVKNRVHPSSSRFDAPSRLLCQLGTVFEEHGTALPTSPWRSRKRSFPLHIRACRLRLRQAALLLAGMAAFNPASAGQTRTHWHCASQGDRG